MFRAEEKSAMRSLAIGEDGLASCGGKGADWAEAGKIMRSCRGRIGEQEDALGAGPAMAKSVFGLEDAG